jgi:aminoglycoside 6'-N-acetyltransferase I
MHRVCPARESPTSAFLASARPQSIRADARHAYSSGGRLARECLRGIVASVLVRRAVLDDWEEVTAMSMDLWPDAPAEEHRNEVRALLAGSLSTLPLVLFVAEDAGRLVGYVEVGLRSHADGCDPSRPCGYIEGWYVAPRFRRSGVGRRLIDAAESWVREQGARELASDTWLDNEDVARCAVRTPAFAALRAASATFANDTDPRKWIRAGRGAD